jgi:hypothetical protein
MKKRVFSLFLIFVLTLTLAPAVFPFKAEAASNVDEFGVPMEAELANPSLRDNPYGTDGWFSMFTKSELVETRTKRDDCRQQFLFRYNQDDSSQSLGSSGRTTESSFTQNKGYSLVATAGFDGGGTGRKEYVANIAYNKDYDRLWLYVTNSGREVAAYRLGDGDGVKYLDDMKNFHAASHMGITAGDFDGDGVDTIILYNLNCTADNPPRLEEYSFNSRSSTLTKVGSVMANIGSAMGGDDGASRLKTVLSDDNGGYDKVRAVPSVCLTAGDVDKDGKDELVFTANWNDLDNDKYGDLKADFQCSWLNVYDKDSGWSKTLSQVLEKDQTASAKGRLRFAGVTIGNVYAESGNVDYPEIVVAGYLDQSSGDGCNIDEGKASVYIYHHTGSGYSRILSDKQVGLNEFTNGGLYDEDKVQDPVCVVAYSAKGPSYADFLFLEGDIYHYENGELKFDARDNYFNDDDDGIDRFIISNGGVVTAVAGNFDGNADGREQVMFVTCQKYKHGSGHFWRTWYYGYDKSGSLKSGNYGWSRYHDGDSAVALAAVDMGRQDGTYAKNPEKIPDLFRAGASHHSGVRPLFQ